MGPATQPFGQLKSDEKLNRVERLSIAADDRADLLSFKSHCRATGCLLNVRGNRITHQVQHLGGNSPRQRAICGPARYSNARLTSSETEQGRSRLLQDLDVDPLPGHAHLACRQGYCLLDCAPGGLNGIHGCPWDLAALWR